MERRVLLPGSKSSQLDLFSCFLSMSELSLCERALGAYLGLAVGDALGATVEFMTPGEIAAQYRVHRQIVGGGWLQLKAGQVTDDTQMSLARGGALLARGGWDLRAVADALVAWMRSRPVDIGNTCRRGIRRYMLHGSTSAEPAADSAGNGAAMRNLPIVLATLGDPFACRRISIEQAHLTHHHPLSDAATLSLARITQLLLHGGGRAACREVALELVEEHAEFRFEPWPGRTSGYIVDTVQTVFDAFFRTASFEECLVNVVNRGGDADTTGALGGQLAGALYGVEAIPNRWLKRLDPAVDSAIRAQSEGLLALARSRLQATEVPLLSRL
jgi:ADP-ribosyl-[dinitrogen reductase] hydrolase